ncbi:LCP family protein [Mycobacterium sp. M1]|uniref:LCP family protein n=1 Tax=Mycolicibacter acidiphilus TaxID=2835306 RepID=A0ABS5RDQ5_9MYCO|nr:LCP family protein [Mycolicibacter acidiphilus]MBS9532415.1 LCP family protein [Mycolicibacter acidiphilus]
MSDGDSAAPGRWAETDQDDGNHQLMTMSPPGAAPWERWQTPAAAAASGGRRRAGSSRRRNGGDGAISVADLIARVGGDTTVETPGRRRAAPDSIDPDVAAPDSIVPDIAVPDIEEAPAIEQPDHWPDLDFDGLPDSADAFDVADLAYPSEMPDLDRIHHAHPEAESDWDESETTTVLPSVALDIPPVRIDPLPHGDLNDFDDFPDLDDADEHDEHAAPARAAHRTHHRMLLAGRALAALIAICALVLTGGAWQWSSTKNKNLNHVSALDLNSHDIVDPGGQVGDVNFLIVGADSRIGGNSDIGAGDASDVEGARSDTIMLVNIPANRKRVVVVSFPRDLAITPLECTVWNPETGAYGAIYDSNTGSYGDETATTNTKLNSTYAFGGPKCLVKEIQKLSGLAINKFMAVDFVGFGKMVDALGGVEVCSRNPLYDDELGTVLENAGRQTVNGTTALNYVRARNVYTETNGDYGRIKRQQLFLSSLLRSLISKDTFMSPTKLNSVVNMFIGDTYVDGVTTKDLVGLGQSLQNLAAGHITFVTVPTSETDENGDEVPRMDDVRALFDAIINDDPLPGENDHNTTSAPTSTAPTSAATPKSSTATTSPSTSATATTASGTRTTEAPVHSEQIKAVTTAPADVTVRVSNGTDQSGLAASAADAFEQAGFNVTGADDYSGTAKATTVLFSPGNEQAAATVAAALPNHPPIERVGGMGSTVRVVLGPDFRTVGKAKLSGSEVSVQLNRGVSVQPTELPEDLTVTNAADTTCE